jgi:hypothetical protein
MTKIISPINSTAASGSLGSTIFSRNKYGFYSYPKPVYSESNTEQQIAIREAFQYCSDQWNTSASLTTPLRNMWAAFASSYPLTDRLGREYYGRARQWFISVNLFKRLAGFSLKWDAPTHASCSLCPSITVTKTDDGLELTLNESLTGENLCYVSVVSNQSTSRNFIPKIAAYGTLWKAGDGSPFLIYPNALISGTFARHFIKVKFIDTRGIQSPTQTLYYDCSNIILPTTIYISDDTVLDETAPNSNFETNDKLLFWDETDHSYCSQLWFDVSTIPAGYNCDEAILQMWGNTNSANGWITSHLTLSPIVFNEATWNIYSTDNNWGTPGGLAGTDYLSDPSDSILIVDEEWNSIDITEIVNAWLNGTYPNYGVFIRGVPDTDSSRVESMDSLNPGLEPYVTLSWPPH